MKPQGIDDELAVLDGDAKRDALDRKIACRFDPGAVELKRRVDVGQLVHRDRRVLHDAPSLRRMLLRRRGLGIAAVDPRKSARSIKPDVKLAASFGTS